MGFPTCGLARHGQWRIPGSAIVGKRIYPPVELHSRVFIDKRKDVAAEDQGLTGKFGEEGP